MHCLNHAVFLLCGLNLDVQNHPSLVSDLGNKATKKQVAHGKHRTPKSSGLFATDTPPPLPYQGLSLWVLGRTHDLLACFSI